MIMGKNSKGEPIEIKIVVAPLDQNERRIDIFTDFSEAKTLYPDHDCQCGYILFNTITGELEEGSEVFYETFSDATSGYNKIQQNMSKAKYKIGDVLAVNDLYRREGRRYFGKALTHKRFKGEVIAVKYTDGEKDGSGEVWPNIYVFDGELEFCEKFLEPAAL